MEGIKFDDLNGSQKSLFYSLRAMTEEMFNVCAIVDWSLSIDKLKEKADANLFLLDMR